MTVLKIKAKNFLSWETLEFELGPGVTLITGFNYDDMTGEGSGKSAILNAPSWCIFGKLPKDTKIDEVIHFGKKTCSVSVEFGGITITRTRNPNDLVLIKDGMEIRGKDLKETQSLVEKAVGLSFDTFCQTLYFPQNYPQKFLSSNQEAKSKILSEIQNLKIYDEAREEVKDRIKSCKTQVQDVSTERSLSEAKLQGVKEAIKILSSNIKQLQDTHQKNLVQKKELIVTAQQELEVLNSKKITLIGLLAHLDGAGKIEPPNKDDESKILKVKYDITSKLEAVDKIQNAFDKHSKDLVGTQQLLENSTNSIKELGDLISEQQLEIKEIKESIKQIQKEKDPLCPTCEKPWEGGKESLLSNKNKQLEKILSSHSKTEAKKIKLLEDHDNLQVRLVDLENNPPEKPPIVESLKEKLKAINLALKGFSEKEKLYKEYQDKHRTILGDLEKNELSITHKWEVVSKLNVDITNEVNNPPNTKELTQMLDNKSVEATNLQESIHASDFKLSDIHLNLAKLETLKDAFRDVKSWVFTNSLNLLNQKVEKFLNELFGMPVSLTFSNVDFKIETDVIINGTPRPLGLCSGGQFKRLCLATDLALGEITKERCGTPFTCLFLDEAFKDLSEASMERVITLLNRRTDPTLMIEHNSVVKAICTQITHVELRDGVTQFCL